MLWIWGSILNYGLVLPGLEKKEKRRGEEEDGFHLEEAVMHIIGVRGSNSDEREVVMTHQRGRGVDDVVEI